MDFPPGRCNCWNKLGRSSSADLDRSGLLSAVEEARNVLWVRLRHRIDAEVMTAARNLKVMVTATTGLNHIDLGGPTPPYPKSYR